MTDEAKNRRDFLGMLKPADHGQPPVQTPLVPTGGSTVRVATRAMACDFSIIMNPGGHEQVSAVGDVLELIHEIESWLSVYKSGSEISRVNRDAASEPVHVTRRLFDLLQVSRNLFEQTGGAFDVAAGAQVQLWKRCRSEQRIPTPQETADVLECSGSQYLRLDDKVCSVGFEADGLQLDPGAIGKGYALDSAVEWLQKTEAAPDSFLLHGGHSSLLARGQHSGQSGWPVGIGNPLFTKKRLGTVLLRDQAMSTSGSNIQFFRHEGRRYGHILDPRNGQPVDGMLSVTVFADSAAVADALSTAFFVLGVENAAKCCDNLSGIGAILIPFPQKGRRVVPTVIGVPADQIFWDHDQVAL
ncbi:MAG: FAD:protein FMN transferase [Fuerstiella sp.]|mgnify:CR=1 FL=1